LLRNLQYNKDSTYKHTQQNKLSLIRANSYLTKLKSKRLELVRKYMSIFDYNKKKTAKLSEFEN